MLTMKTISVNSVYSGGPDKRGGCLFENRLLKESSHQQRGSSWVSRKLHNNEYVQVHDDVTGRRKKYCSKNLIGKIY
jgi:hypothetical protein